MAKLIDLGEGLGVVSYPDDTPDEKIVADYDALKNSRPLTLGDYAKQVGGSLIRGFTETAAAVPGGAATLSEATGGALPRTLAQLTPLGRAFSPLLEGVRTETGFDIAQPAQDIARREAELISRAGEAISPAQVSELQQSFWATSVPRGIGSSLAFLGGGAVGAAARVPAWLTIGGLGSLVSGQDFYNEAKQFGADDRTAHLASIIGNIVGTTEAMPLAGIIRRLDRLTGNTFSRAMIDAGTETLQEALQEGVQQLAQNWTAKKLYDEDRDLFEQVSTGAGAGGVTGFLMSSLASALGIPIRRSYLRHGEQLRRDVLRGAVERGEIFNQPLGETYAEGTRTETETGRVPETPGMVGGEEGRLRLRNAPENRVGPITPTTTETLTTTPAPPITQGITRSNVDFVVADVIQNWTNAPPIRVVQSFNELPQAIKDNHLLSGKRPEQLPAITDDAGTVWLVSDNITGPDDVKTLLSHEALGHRGVEAVFGDVEQFNRFMQGVDQLHADTPLGNSVRALYGTDPVIVGREIVAKLAENPQEDPGLWDTIVATVRGWVRKVFNIDVSDNDVRVLLARGRRRVTEAPATTTQPLVTEPREALITPKQNELIRLYQLAHREVQKRTEYGIREETPSVRSYVATWSNSAKRWDVTRPFRTDVPRPTSGFDTAGIAEFRRMFPKGLPNYAPPGSTVRLDANQILIPATSLRDATLIAQHLPVVPLDKFSAENNPIFSTQELTPESLSRIEQFYDEFQKRIVDVPDEIRDVSNFIDAIRSPEQISEPTETPTLKDAPVTYAGFQPGFGKIPGFHLYNLTETIAPHLVKGSTVTENSLNEAGFKVPDSVKAMQSGQGFRASLRSPTVFNTRQQVEQALSDPLLRPAAIEFGRQMAQVQSSMTTDQMAGFLMGTPKDEPERIAQRILDYLLDRRYLADTVRWFNSLPATTDEEKQVREVAASVILGHYGTDRTTEQTILTNIDSLKNQLENATKRLQVQNTQELKANFLTAAFNHLTTEFKRYLANRTAVSPAGENLQAQWRERMNRAQEELGKWEKSPTAIKKALSALAVTAPDNLLQTGTNQQIIDWTIQNGALFGEVSDEVQEWLLRDDGTGSPALLGYSSLASDLQGLRDVLNHQQAIRRDIKAFEEWFQPSGKARAISPKQFAERYFRLRTQRDRAMRIAKALETDVDYLDNNIRGNIIALNRLQEMMRSPQYTDSVKAAIDAADVVVRAIYDVETRAMRGLIERGGKTGAPPGLWTMKGPETGTEYVVDLAPATAKEQRNQGQLKAFAQEARSFAEKSQATDPIVADQYKNLADYIDRFYVHPALDPSYGFTQRPYIPIPGTNIRIPMDILGWAPKTIKDTLEKIGGRPVRQAVLDMWELDTVMKKVEALNNHQKYGYAKQAEAVLSALESHKWTPDQFGRWDEMIAEPIIASSQNKLSAQYEVGDVIVGSGGEVVTTEDMAAVRLMKEWADAVLGAAPKSIRDTYGDLGVTRKAIGGARFTMARIVAPWVQSFINNEWRVAAGDDAARWRLITNPETGAFRRIVMGYIGETNPELDKQSASSPSVSPFYPIYRKMAQQERLRVRSFNNIEEVLDFMADEMVDRGLAPNVAEARTKAQTGLYNEISDMIQRFESEVMNRKTETTFGDVPEGVINQATANNSFTLPRGSLIAPSTFYSYSMASYPRRAIHIGQLRSFLDLKLLQSLYEAQRGLESAKAAMDRRIDQLTKSGMSQAQARGVVLKESTASRKASEIRYDYLEIESALRMLEKVRKELERFEISTTEHYGNPQTEAWMNVFGSLKSFLLSSVQAIMTNTGSGVMLGPAMVHLQTGRLRNAFTDFVREPHFWATLYRRLSAAVANNPVMSKLLRQHAPLWNNLANTILDAATDWKRLEDMAQASGMVSPYNLMSVLANKAALKTTAGRLEQESPSAVVRTVNSIMSAPLARVGVELPRALTPRVFDNFINYALLVGFEYETEFLKKQGWRAYKTREARAAQTGADWTDLSKPENILTPGDLGIKSFKSLNRYRELFAGLGSLDQVMLDFYQRTKNMSEDERREAPLIPDENDHLAAALQYAAITNVSTETNRPHLFKGKGSEGLRRNIAGTFMGWTVNILRQLSKTMESYSRDPKFDSIALNMVGLASLVLLFTLAGMVNWELGDELTKIVYTQHSARIQAKAVGEGLKEGDWQTGMLYFIQALVNTVPVMGPIMGGFAGLPFTGRGNPFDVTSWNPILGWIYDTWNTGKRILQTGDAVLPMADYTRRWVPFTKIILNRLPLMRGLVDQQNAVRSLAGSALPGTEIKWGTRQPGAMAYSPANDEIQKLIASAYEHVAHGGDLGEVYKRYQEAVDAYVRAGRSPTDAPRALASALSGKEPVRVLTGREMTPEEEQRWVARMNTQQKEDYDRAVQAWNVLSSVSGRDLNMVSAPTGGGGPSIPGLVPPLRGAGAGLPAAPLAAVAPLSTGPRLPGRTRTRPLTTRRRPRGLSISRRARRVAGPRISKVTTRRRRSLLSSRFRRRYTSLTS